jgi:hypothetical protein
MRIRSRKAQITLFVILGIVLLIVVVFLLSMRKSVQPKTTNNYDKIIKEFETGLVKDHITSCIASISSDGIEKLGANGGLIYDFEGGRVPLKARVSGKDFLNYTYLGRTYYVQYGLRQNAYCPIIDYSIPGYPYPGKNLSELNQLYAAEPACIANNSAADKDGFFGQVTIPKLCYAAKDSSCEAFAKGEVLGFSMQKQLEDYVSRRLPDCVNLSSFSDDFDADISPDGSPIVRASIRDSNVVFNVDYPVRISFQNSTPVMQIFNYQAPIGVRLGASYNLLYDAFSLDSRNHDFVLTDQFIISNFWKPGLELRRTAKACPGCQYPLDQDSIIEVFDRSSNVNGKPFYLRVAVQERAPVLDYLADQVYDIASPPPSGVLEVNIPIKAYDPDDFGLRYYFFSGEAGAPWRKSNESLVFDQGEVFLRFPLTYLDYGNHSVEVMVVDDAGLFDFQRFSVSVIDSTGGNPPAQECLEYCANYSDLQGLSTDCNYWCWIAASPCVTKCPVFDLNEFDVSTSACAQCVDKIYKVGSAIPSDSCSWLDKVLCLDGMPGCFWIKKVNDDFTFSEGCYNEYELGSVGNKAHILLQ